MTQHSLLALLQSFLSLSRRIVCIGSSMRMRGGARSQREERLFASCCPFLLLAANGHGQVHKGSDELTALLIFRHHHPSTAITFRPLVNDQRCSDRSLHHSASTDCILFATLAVLIPPLFRIDSPPSHFSLATHSILLSSLAFFLSSYQLRIAFHVIPYAAPLALTPATPFSPSVTRPSGPLSDHVVSRKQRYTADQAGGGRQTLPAFARCQACYCNARRYWRPTFCYAYRAESQYGRPFARSSLVGETDRGGSRLSHESGGKKPPSL